MVWGTCPVCDRLVPIEPKGFRAPDGRHRQWFPVDHDHEGRQCPGVKKHVR